MAKAGPSVNYHSGKKSHLVIIDPDNSLIPGKTDVLSVVDTIAISGKTITFMAKRLGNGTSSKMKIQLTGQGLPPGLKPKDLLLDAGFLSITLTNPAFFPPPPDVDTLPVDYVDDNS